MDQATAAGGQHGGTAVVIGGSMAGMLAARVLADHFGRVILVERDRFPAGPEGRKGVPQGRHVHALLMRGATILEALFPVCKTNWARRARRCSTPSTTLPGSPRRGGPSGSLRG